MKTKKYLLVLLFIPFGIIAQNNTNPKETPEYIKDGAFTKDHNQEKVSAYVYPEIEEKDIVWSRILWREIDMRQKFNHHFYFPAITHREFLDDDQMSLIDVIMEELYKQASYELSGAKEGDCYNCDATGFVSSTSNASVASNQSITPTDTCMYCKGTAKLRLDCFKIGSPTIPGKEFDWGTKKGEDILNIGLKDYIPRYKASEIPGNTNADSLRPYDQKNIDEVATAMIDGEPANFTLVPDPANPGEGKILLPKSSTNFDRTQVKRWRIKEEMFFDKKRSKMATRIIGLCPVIPDFTSPNTGKLLEYFELFWIYYPDWRDIFSRTTVVNLNKNDAQKRSYLALFEKRMFGSTITMESNIMNRQISDYNLGLNALLEAERIKEEIFNIEHDMWEY